MAQKETILNNDKILLPLFIITLIIISALIGNFIHTFFLSLILILAISFVYSIIIVKSFDRKLINKIKESSYVLSFSFLTALIAAIILPYFLFHNSFLNIFIIQYVYLLPVSLVFFSSLCLYSSIINNIQPNLKRILTASLIISLISSVIISLLLVIGSNYIYNQRTQMYNQQFKNSVTELNAATARLYTANYIVFEEIKTYQNNFIESANKQKNTFQNFDANKGFCISTNCAKPVVDQIIQSVYIIVNSEIIKTTLKQANNESMYIRSEEFKKNFTSLDEYKTYLKNKIDASNFTITYLSDENKNTLNLFESGFTYQDFQTQRKEFEGDLRDAAITSISENNSLLYNSLSYTVEHSIPFKEAVRLVITFAIYTGQQIKNSDLFVELYNNKDINESSESKIIRYKLILNKIRKK
ncbi:MAG: hypothetical protein NTV63_01760 [Candidatus Woesearchaeota archaeon]|nr:hypothetical protein [Candidatus Woesearchaeota archaeon]